MSINSHEIQFALICGLFALRFLHLAKHSAPLELYQILVDRLLPTFRSSGAMAMLILVAYCLLPVTNCPLPIAHHLSPIAYRFYLLPFTFYLYLLPFTFYLLPF